MRILQLTPGTGNFYCGTCIRDNALALTLREQGHDVVMAPMYLPHLVDEPEVATAPMQLGGLNVYLKEKSALFRNAPQWVTNALNARWLLRLLAGFSGSTSPNQLGEMTVSMLRGEEGGQRNDIEKLGQWIETVGPFDAITLSSAMLCGMVRPIRRHTDAPIVVTLQGEDSFLDAMPEPYRTQAWQVMGEHLIDADLLIAVSDYYADVMRRRLGYDEGRILAERNGITLQGYDPPATRPQQHTVGFLSRMIEGKGLTTLVDAFIELKREPDMAEAKLRVAGSCVGPDVKYVAGLKRKLKGAGVGDDVEWLANVSRDEKLAFLRSLSVLSVPATYGESFGLYVIEALAMGVPVVQPRHGGFVEIIEDTQGGILVKPDDVSALAQGLAQVLRDEDRRAELARCGREAVFDRYGSEHMAQRVYRHVERAIAAKRGNTPA